MKRNPAGKNAPATTAPARFPVWQTTLAESIGCTLEELRDLREAHLVPEVDWRYDARHHIVLTEGAAQKLAGLALASGSTGRAKLLSLLRQRASLAGSTSLPAAVLKPIDAALTVQRAAEFIKNRRIVQARLERANEQHAAGAIVSVWVRDNRAFRPGDALTGRWAKGLFYHITSRPPRRVPTTA